MKRVLVPDQADEAHPIVRCAVRLPRDVITIDYAAFRSVLAPWRSSMAFLITGSFGELDGAVGF